jgi:hypothetical protein
VENFIHAVGQAGPRSRGYRIMGLVPTVSDWDLILLLSEFNQIKSALILVGSIAG